MKGIAILGSTGSIGVSTLDVIHRHPDRFKVIALTAQKNKTLLLEQCIRFQPQYAILEDATAANELKAELQISHPHIHVLAGNKIIEEIVAIPEINIVMAAIVGAAGLLPTLAAVQAGKQVLLANKEALVMAGSLFMDAVKKNHAILLPIDSEHNAIFQCLSANFTSTTPTVDVNKIVLTASGGAFRDLPLSDLTKVTPEQACTHPNWKMGRKITVDSSTMMNKGLEVIEAHWLFGMPAEKIEVLMHPQSIVHSLVEYKDGSVIAQLGNPDMRTPIAHALAWPERIESGVEPLDLLVHNCLNFKPVDFVRYPCLRLAYQALKTGGTATTILNAANEVAVQAFLDHKIKFTDIRILVEKTLTELSAETANELEVILAADKTARQIAESTLYKI